MPESSSDADPGAARAWRLRDGTPVVIRAPRPDDEAALAAFHRELSDRSVYQRYFSIARADPSMTRIPVAASAPDETERFSLAVEVMRADAAAIIGIGALVRARNDTSAEMALVIADAYQGRGLGTELLRRLIAIARAQGIRSVAGEMLPGNQPMHILARREGFTLSNSPGDTRLVRAEKLLP